MGQYRLYKAFAEYKIPLTEVVEQGIAQRADGHFTVCGDFRAAAEGEEIVDRLLNLRMYYDNYRPILLKVSPDLSKEQLDDIVDYCLRSGIDGIVAGNTTRSREGLTIDQAKIEKIGNGGMSGAPVHKKNVELVRYIHTKSEGKLPIVGVGGIMSPKQAKAMLDAGASLVEIYSGFIFEGPALIKNIIKYLENTAK